MKNRILAALAVIATILALVLGSATAASAHPNHPTIKNSSNYTLLMDGSIGGQWVAPGALYGGISHTASGTAVFIPRCWVGTVTYYSNGVYSFRYSNTAGPRWFEQSGGSSSIVVTAVRPYC